MATEITVLKTEAGFVVHEVRYNIILSRVTVPLMGGVFSLSDGRRVILNDLGVFGVVPPVRQLEAGVCYTLED